MSAANKALIQRYVEMWNTGNLTLIDEILAPDLVCRFYGLTEVRGLEVFKQMAPFWKAAFPDFCFTIETIIAEDNLVAMHGSWRGTHRGEYLGIAATGKQITETGTRFYRIVGGKIAEMWGDENVLGLLQQLSAIESLPLLEITEETIALAKDLVRLGPLPEKAAVDALHIAIAMMSRVDYLLTWNCKHLANAALRSRIERVCRARGYDPVIICTPEELLED